MSPFEKYLGKEDHLQIQVCRYLNAQYPNAFWMHTPNEGKRSKFEQYKLRVLGCISGIPDILIFDKTKEFSGCFIELKIKPNKPTPNQRSCMDKLSERGWQGNVCYTFEEAKKIIDDYFKP